MEETIKNSFGKTITKWDKVYIYHHFDADGYASAAAVALNYYGEVTGDEEHIESLVPIEYYSCTHSKPMKLDKVDICLNCIVYIVDYSFSRLDDQKEIKRLLKEGVKIVWNDHHETSKTIEAEHTEFKDLPGSRVLFKRSPYAGCYLTWEYLYQFKEIPEWIRLTSDHDTWQDNQDAHDFVSAMTFEGLQDTYLNPDTQSILRLSLKGKVPESFIEEKIKKGATLREIDTIRNERKVKRCAWESELSVCINKESIDPENALDIPTNENGYIKFDTKILVINAGGNSTLFGEKFEEYDAVCTINTNDGVHWTHTMFSKANGGLPVNVLALFFGQYFGITGGGHEHAAGWTATGLCFKKNMTSVVTSHKIELEGGGINHSYNFRFM